jgi:putative aldouronate transport system permease protein
MIKYKKSYGSHIFDIGNYILLIFLAFITLYPFLNQIGVSLSAVSDRVILFPSKISFHSYEVAFHYKAIWIGFKNSIVRMLIGTFLSLFFTSMAAYSLSKGNLPFRKFFIVLILITMLFGGGLIPSYLLIKNLGMLNTIWAIVIPGMVSGFNIYIMSAFFKSIPASLEESAKVDGASYYKIFFMIVIPLSLPVIATVGLWVAVGYWNEWFSAMIYIRDPKKYVLQVVLREIIVNNQTQGIEGLAMIMTTGAKLSTRQLQATVIMISTIPMLLIYPFLQKFFVKGIMIGAVKE